MKIKIRWLVAIETIIILLLVAFIIYSKMNGPQIETNNNNPSGLLSPRVYSGLLKPKSFLIVNFDPLRVRLQEYIKQQKLNVSIYVENLRNGAQMGINEDIGLYPASLNKLPIAILVMDKIEKGSLSFDTLIAINQTDNTDPSSYFHQNKLTKASVRVLIEKMLKDSDNTAFYTLLRIVDKHDLGTLLNYYSLNPESTYIIPTMQDRNGFTNFVTPVDISNVFASLYLSTVLKPNDSEYILSLLTDNVFDIKKIASLPDDVKVAQKFGAYYANGEKLFHDCGIIYAGETRLLFCIMTKNLDEPDAVKNVGAFVHAIYSYTNATREQLDTFKRNGSIALYS